MRDPDALPTGLALERHLWAVVPGYVSLRPRLPKEKLKKGQETVYATGPDGHFRALVVSIEDGDTVREIVATSCAECGLPKDVHTKRVRHVYAARGRAA